MRKKMISFLYGLLLLGSCFLLVACQGQPTEKATYQLDLSGTVQAGVIDYLGLEMNVYRDAQSNPCGDCPDQPVSVYAGAGAEEVAGALAEAVKRADDIWVVKSLKGTTLLLEEKNIGTAKEPAPPEAPPGLTIRGTFTAAH
ncbi:hypothetical protein [Candidatus Formimonas warabiya]|uniref:Lipoprotein n=1 Tax=Formimonas warabiya TaxID=1761012 RepID=A0A3G1KSY5_FORW1|nr:hypothetical protein [Candidatus Formimonas warabiya]ATW25592.1 hypothetical protein DCMF_13240 [Candidatus Formimonas warabiya]